MQFHELKKENDQSATVQMIKLFTSSIKITFKENSTLD